MNPSLLIVIYLLAFCVVFFFIRKLSLQNSKKDTNKYVRSTAIVIGGSFAGIVHARVLSDYYEKVIIFERDKLDPKSFEIRRGVPQGAHIHILLQKGLILLRDWFPHFETSLINTGAEVNDFYNDHCIFHYDTFLPRFNLGGKYKIFCCRRPTLETVLRNQLLKIPNIELRDHTTVCSLVEKNGKIEGVEYYSGLDNETIHFQSGDLVIDCSGIRSQAPKWLENIGYKPPRTEQVNSYLQYVTCFFKNFDNTLPGENSFSLLTILPKCPESRASTTLPIGNGIYQVMLGSLNKDYIHTDLKSFLNFTENLPNPTLHNALKNATPVSEIYEYKYKGSIRHFYNECKLPERFIVAGDALSSFTPIYGQGITVAALEAKKLEELLQANCSPSSISTQYYRKIRRVVRRAWKMATQADLKYPGTEGKRSIISKMLGEYFETTLRLGSTDPYLFEVVVSVMNVMESPFILFRPYVVFSVLCYYLGIKKIKKQNTPYFASTTF